MKKFLKPRVWLAVEAEVPFGGRHLEKQPPPKYVSEAGWSKCQDRETGMTRSSMSSQKWAQQEGRTCHHQAASDQRTHATLHFSVLRPESGRAPTRPEVPGDACALQLWATQ